MTLQANFDKSVKAQLAQAAYAYDTETDTCLYFNHEGNRCMIGHLGSEEQANEWEDGLLTITTIGKSMGWDEDLTYDLRAMQIRHDALAEANHGIWDEAYFLEGMKDFAQIHKLDWNHAL